MSHESTRSLDGARGPPAHPPRPDGGQLDTAAPGARRGALDDRRAARPRPLRARRPKHRQNRRPAAGKSPANHRGLPGSHRIRPLHRFATRARAYLRQIRPLPAPSSPALLLARGAPAGPPGHSTGDSPAVHRETAGPDLDPRPAARPRLPARKPECFTGSKRIRDTPHRGAPAGPPGRSPAIHRRFTGASPAPARAPSRTPRAPAPPRKVRCFTGSKRSATPPQPEKRRPDAGHFSGDSPAVHRGLTGKNQARTSRRLPLDTAPGPRRAQL